MAKRRARKPEASGRPDRRQEVNVRPVWAADPVGAAADQCYRFRVERTEIKKKGMTARIIDLEDCVFLSSAAIEDGVATFTVCCKKTEDGKCKNCRTEVALQIYKVEGPIVLSETVTVECRKN